MINWPFGAMFRGRRFFVLRKKLSLKGYSELKLLLKMDNQKVMESNQDIDAICGSYQSVAQSIKDLDCSLLFEKIDASKRVFVYGIGMIQSSIKKELRRLFMHAGVMIYDVRGGTEAEQVLDIVDENDFFILISISGENEEVLELAKKLKVENIAILSLTKRKDNSLSRMVDYRLFVDEVMAQDTYLGMKFDSLASYFVLIEILFMKYDRYKSNREAGGITCS